MEDYDAFCNHARVYTEVHARPNAAQRAIIDERNQKEKQKSASETQKGAEEPTISAPEKPEKQEPIVINTLKPQSSAVSELEECKEGLRQRADEVMTEQGENLVPLQT